MSETIRIIRRRVFCWRTWLHGLLGAFIQSGATAVSVMVIDPQKFNLGEGLANIGKLMLVSGLIGAALYLKSSPVPPEETIEAPAP
jgi:hypothetical protein